MSVSIDNKRYVVVESMGFNHSVGMYAKMVKTDDGERMAVKPRGGVWRFWGAKDRTKPLRDAAERGTLTFATVIK